MVQKLIYIIAGEASGDTLGADFMQSLQTLHPGAFRFKGVGGPLMLEQGLESLFPMSDINHMGLIEVIKYLPLIWQRLKQTVSDIKGCNPDLLLTIDSPDFTLRLGKRVRSARLPHVHYVAPTVWAWRPKRAKKIAKQIDHLLTLYDFEPAYFLRENLETTFVGHPLAARFQFFKKVASPSYLALLPGSRIGEITRLLPVFLESVRLLQKKFPTLKYWLPTLKERCKMIKDILDQHQLSDIVTIVYDPDTKENYFKSTIAAVAASGTVTLELGLMGIPTVISYKLNCLTALLGKMLIKTPFIGLPNIILNELYMPELIQEKCTAIGIYCYLEKFIANKSYGKKFEQKRKILINKLKNTERTGLKAANVICKKIFNL